ncbi:MAG: FAA hydrolase family protein [Calditrichaeota bacterium]|nr:MAG: FAA hydrolase family protein [Calditrichota bacterium]
MAASIYSKALSDRIQDLKTLLLQGNRVLEEVRSLVENISYQLENNLQSIPDEVLLDAHHVRLAAPIHNPQKIIAIGLNYRDHCEENGLTPPEFPITFAKYPSAIIGPDEPIVWPPEISQKVDYEAEFAVVIGRTARYVSEKQAMDYVAGYTIINDVSARDVQFADGQWVRAKSLDTFCPMGPALVTCDEIPDPHCLELKCIVNGKILQQSNTRYLIFGVAYLVSYLSKSFTLFPGDIISTGTPGGVGYYRKPQVFLKPGDSVTIEIDKLGQLTNPVEKWRPPLAG